jgi:cell division protein YceG involved in septum cleavage
MLTAKKNITVLVLILLLAIPMLFAFVNIVKQQILHNTTKERYGKEILQTISIAKKNLHWVKKEKEVIIDGKYFDVKSYTTDGDNILLTGFYDLHEDKLVKQIKKLMQQKNGSNNPLNQSVVKYFFFPIFTNQSNIDFEQHWKLTSSAFYSYTEDISEIYTPSFSPPPEELL